MVLVNLNNVSKRQQAIPLLITLVIILIHNVATTNTTSNGSSGHSSIGHSSSSSSIGGGVDWDWIKQRVRARMEEGIPGRIEKDFDPNDEWAGHPGIRSVRRLQQEILYEFEVTAAFVFPSDFEFATDSPVSELRGAGRLTQLFYRRIMAQQYPESYVQCDTTNNGGLAEEDNEFPFIILFILTNFTFRLVGDVPTAQECFVSALANNDLFLGGNNDDIFDTSPTGFNPVDYLGFIRQTQPPEIFVNTSEASIIFVDFLPTAEPSSPPTGLPSASPSDVPSMNPSENPSSQPSNNPTPSVTPSPTSSTMPSGSLVPSLSPSASPDPSMCPSMMPTPQISSDNPSSSPSQTPSDTPSQSPSSTPTSMPTDGSFSFTGTNQNVPTADFGLIDGAFARLNEIVTGDISNQISGPDAVNQVITFNPNARICNVPQVIDDLHICISYNVDLLETGILGRAGLIELRGANDPNPFLPFISAIDLRPDLADTADIFQAVVRHESFHSLGAGIIWNTLGLVNNDDTPTCEYRPDTTAGAQFRLITGCPTNFAIPLQPTVCSHWEEDCFGGQEILNPVLSVNPLPVISTVTIGTLIDMGYEADLTAADPLTDENFSEECMCNANLMPSTSSSSSKVKPPPISDAALAEATANGLEVLSQMKEVYEGSGGDEARRDGSTIFLGHKAVIVYILDGEYIREVIVRA